MAKSVSDAVLDALLNRLKNHVSQITITAGEPTGYTSAITQGAQMLARHNASAGVWTGPANGDTSGRKLTINQITGIPISGSGGANHVNLVQASGTQKEFTTTATSQTLTAGNTLTLNTFKIEVADPT